MAHLPRCSLLSLASFLAGVDDPLPAFRNFCGVLLVVIAITGIYTFGVLPRITTFEMLIAALMPTFVLFGWMAARPATARLGSWFAIFTSVQLALQSSYEAQLLFLCQLQHRARGRRRAHGRHMRHRSLARNQLDRKSTAPQQLENARCGRRTQVARGSRRDRQSHAASAGPACRAHHRRSCRGQKRRRQSSPAENRSEHHQSPAGESWPVTLHNGGDRRISRPSCFGLPGPRGPPTSGRAGRTARQHDRINVARAGERGPQRGAYRPCRYSRRALP